MSNQVPVNLAFRKISEVESFNALIKIKSNETADHDEITNI